MKSYFLSFILFVSVQSTAQPGGIAAAFRPTAYSRLHQDIFSYSGNQAALASGKNFSAGVCSERRFMLQELSNHLIAMKFPVSSGSFGIGAHYFGSAFYNETTASLAYGRSLGSMIDIGIGFNYNTLTTRGFGSTHALNFDAGFILHFTELFHVGSHLHNPTHSKFSGTEAESLPVVYSAGFGYDLSESFFLGAEMEKQENQPVSFNPGIQYKPAGNLMIRTGLCSGTSSFYMGAGLLFKEFRIDITAAVHPSLGISSGLSLIYSSNK